VGLQNSSEGVATGNRKKGKGGIEKRVKKEKEGGNPRRSPGQKSLPCLNSCGAPAPQRSRQRRKKKKAEIIAPPFALILEYSKRSTTGGKKRGRGKKRKKKKRLPVKPTEGENFSPYLYHHRLLSFPEATHWRRGEEGKREKKEEEGNNVVREGGLLFTKIPELSRIRSTRKEKGGKKER